MNSWTSSLSKNYQNSNRLLTSSTTSLGARFAALTQKPVAHSLRKLTLILWAAYLSRSPCSWVKQMEIKRCIGPRKGGCLSECSETHAKSASSWDSCSFKSCMKRESSKKEQKQRYLICSLPGRRISRKKRRSRLNAKKLRKPWMKGPASPASISSNFANQSCKKMPRSESSKESYRGCMRLKSR